MNAVQIAIARHLPCHQTWSLTLMWLNSFHDSDQIPAACFSKSEIRNILAF
jgi:hypothetical protein